MANEFKVTDDDTLNSSVLVSFMGPSSSGKTYSAHEWAVGYQSVMEGNIGVIDTEAHRAKHYRHIFQPRLKQGGRLLHLALEAPFSADRYAHAMHQLVEKHECKTLIIDSTSHSWDGPGGLLEQHEAEVERLSKGREDAYDRVGALAWVRPKKTMRSMVTDVSTSLRVAAAFCFRAQEKRNWNKKDPKTRQPVNRGWIPIGDPSLVYEMTVNFLLNPSSDGMPDWAPGGEDAGRVLKRPRQFRSFLLPGVRIQSAMGGLMAKWAKGEPMPLVTEQQLANAITRSETLAELNVVGRDMFGDGCTHLEQPVRDKLAAHHEKRFNELRRKEEPEPQQQGRR